MTLFGVHTGPQNCTLDDLRRVWHLADRSGFHWISIWDHFYPAMIVPGDAQGTCFEAVSIMTALAAETTNVRVGSLVYCMAYRHPAVLANAMVTVDHVSGGGGGGGLGGGWGRVAIDAHGLPLPPRPDPAGQVEEGIQIIRDLFTQETTTFRGKHYQVVDARCDPKPMQSRPRLWLGGMGEKRLLRMVAKYADGWNVPFIGPDIFAAKNQVLDRWCDKERRGPQKGFCPRKPGLANGRRPAPGPQKHPPPPAHTLSA